MTVDEMRAFGGADYPHGCRCACCSRLFEDGDPVIDREVAEEWSTPTCEACAESNVPLCADHPFAQTNAPIFCADGMVR